MAAEQKSITSRFRQIVRDLLLGIAPPEGAAALFLRRGLGSNSVYFPIGFAPGENLVCPSSILNNYYLFSMHWPAHRDDDQELLLNDDSGMEPLILHGKLALALFDHGPAAIRVHPCDLPNQRAGDVLLCTLRRPSTGAPPPSPSFSLRTALARVVDVWRDLARSTLTFDIAEHTLVGERLAAILADQIPEPPYFTTYHVKVESRPGKRGTLRPGIWQVNSLSYNCLLRDERDATRDYICKMFVTNGEAWVDRPAATGDALIDAIIDVCDDLVHQIGLHESTGTVVYARRNIERGSCLVDPKTYPEVVGSRNTSPSLWTVLRSSLVYMQKEHRDSALVTFWAGRANDVNEVVALPMGFVPGSRSDLMSQVAQNPKLHGTGRVYEETSQNGRLVVTAILPPGNVQEHRAFAERHIRSVLDEAACAVHGAAKKEIRYPGPYVLDFKGDETKECDIVTDHKKVPLRCVQTSKAEQLTYQFLCALARSDFFMSHEQLNSWPAGRGKKSTKIAEVAGKLLASLGLDPDAIFKLRHGQGYELAIEKHQVKRVPRGAEQCRTRAEQADAEFKQHGDPDRRSRAPHEIIDAMDELTAEEQQVYRFDAGEANETFADLLRRLGITQQRYDDLLESARIKVQMSSIPDDGRSESSQ